MSPRLERAIDIAADVAFIGFFAGIALVVVGATNRWPVVQVAGQVLMAPGIAAFLIFGIWGGLRHYAGMVAGVARWISRG